MRESAASFPAEYGMCGGIDCHEPIQTFEALICRATLLNAFHRASYVFRSFFSSYYLIKDTQCLLLYCLAAGTNAFTGIVMAPRSKVASRLAFRVASTVQLALGALLLPSYCLNVAGNVGVHLYLAVCW